MLNNLRVISKNRITKEFGKLKAPKLDEIDKIILEHFIPQTHKMNEDSKKEAEANKIEIERLTNENTEKDIEINQLKQIIQDKELETV